MPLPTSPPLLATKLFLPRLRQSLVVRPRLSQLLDAARTHPLTLVSAPAGFGKTTLVAAWVQQQPLPAAWLSLDAADNDPNRFLRYFVAALHGCDARIGQTLHQALESGQAPPLEQAVIALINDLAELPHDLLLVLDDFHLIDEPRIEAALGALVAYQPPQLHLLIVTREDPPLPLARLRGQGLLAELRAQELRFTPDEAAVFLNETMGLALSGQQVADLDARIEGWVAGLQLAGLSLQKSDDPAGLVAGLSSNHHFILTYLTDEVLRRQPPDIQDFLLQTSVLKSMSGPLCDAVLGRSDSATALAALYAANTFVVPLDEDHTWFRYHHLFSELLRVQLQRTQLAVVAPLHRRAAAWFAAEGDAAGAIDHTLAAGDFAEAVLLLERHARRLVVQGYGQTVAVWLQRLPEAWRVAGPQTNMAFAWSLLLSGQIGEIEGYLRNAEAALTEAHLKAGAEPRPRLGEPHADLRQGLQAEILGLRAGLVSLRGDPVRACAMAREAVALAPPDDVYIQGATRFCLATAYNYAGRTVEAIAIYQEALPLCLAAGNTVAAMLSVANLALLSYERGALQEAAALCRKVLAEAQAQGAMHSPALSAVHGALAHVLYEWNDLAMAYHEVQQALDLGRRSGHVAAVAYSGVVLARIQGARGDLQGAAQSVEQAQQLRSRTMPSWVAPYIIAQQVALALAHGNEQAAKQVLAESDISTARFPDHTREVIHLAHLRLLLWQVQRPGAQQAEGFKHLAATALLLAERVYSAAEGGGRIGRMVEAQAQRALVLAAQDRGEMAQQALDAALRLAAPSGYVRLFLEVGPGLAALLAGYAAPADLDAYVLRLRREFSAVSAAAEEITAPVSAHPHLGAPPGSTPLVEPLSAREIEVLKLMAQGLTYQEVAARLIVSLNTVRFHVKSIYGKLGVDNRTAALERARSLQVL
jgi:LuxR family maltose regulon positive regulatory protein